MCSDINLPKPDKFVETLGTPITVHSAKKEIMKFIKFKQYKKNTFEFKISKLNDKFSS